MTREVFRNRLSQYSTEHNEEQACVPRFLSLLEYDNCYKRELEFGHITASAWITNQEKSKVLLMHHVKLNRWLQPGGHADGEEDVLKVAEKEMAEETGLLSYQLATPDIFDLDIHKIPGRKGVPAHDHYDVRFHFISTNPTEIAKNEESNDLKWIPISEVSELVGQERSIVRMIEKCKD